MNTMTVINNTPTMSSVEIANLTGKNHSDVLRDIRNTLEQAGIGESRFASTYLDAQGKDRPCYKLPKLECDLVMTGYSVPYRLAILTRWQQLETAMVKPMSPAEHLVQQATMILSQERKLAEVDARVAMLESKQNPEGDGFYSLKAYANIKGTRMTNATASALGKRCTKLSRDYGVMTGTVPDSQFGTVHTYHESILEEVLSSSVES